MNKKFPSLISLLTRRDLVEYAIVDLGQYAFAQKRNAGYEAPEDEPDTAEETSVWKELRGHFQDNSPISYSTAASVMSYLRRGEYADVFSEPPSGTGVYRGIAVDPSFFRKHGIKQFDSMPEGSVEKNISISPGGLYKVWGKKPGESWTTSPSKAAEFATVNMQSQDQVAVVMVARPEDNPQKFAIGKDGLYKVTGLDMFGSEDEVLAIGPINVHKVYWSDPSRGADPWNMQLVDEEW